MKHEYTSLHLVRFAFTTLALDEDGRFDEPNGEATNGGIIDQIEQ